MKPRYQATRAAVDMIKRFEGFRAKAAELPDGRWTVGYGHTKSARAGVEITEADADALLIYDVATVVAAINAWVFSPLTQNQFDALVAFAFNIGLPNFRRSSVLRRLNEGSHLQAACAMEMWRTADFEGERIVIDALVRRRSAEMALFLTPMEGYIAVPSLVIVPRVDEQVAQGAPNRTTQLETPLDTAIAAAVRAEEAEPMSAAMTAAAAITARLNAMLPDGEAPSLAVEDVLMRGPLPPLEDAPVAAAMTPEPVVEAEPDPEPQPELAMEAEPIAVGQSMPLMFRAPSAAPFARRHKKRAPAPVLVLMGLTGLGVAGAGPFWGFTANALVPDAEIAGMGVGLAGVGLLAASVYMLLARLAGQND